MCDLVLESKPNTAQMHNSGQSIHDIYPLQVRLKGEPLVLGREGLTRGWIME